MFKFCNHCFEYCLENSEILSSMLSPLLPLHVNIFQILFALLFVRGAFFCCKGLPKLLHDGVRQSGVGSTSSRAYGLARNFPALGLDDLTLTAH